MSTSVTLSSNLKSNLCVGSTTKQQELLERLKVLADLSAVLWDSCHLIVILISKEIAYLVSAGGDAAAAESSGHGTARGPKIFNVSFYCKFLRTCVRLKVAPAVRGAGNRAYRSVSTDEGFLKWRKSEEFCNTFTSAELDGIS